MIEVFIIGTGAAIPSKKRGHTTVAIRRKGEIFLFDCGENTQRRLIEEGISPMKIEKIFITHMHTDHVAGLFPLPETMYLLRRTTPLDIYGPKGLERFGNALKTIQNFNLSYEVSFNELLNRKMDVIDANEYRVVSVPVRHGTPSVGYCFEEKERLKFLEAKAMKMGVGPGPQRGRLTHKQNISIDGKTIKWKDVTEEVPGQKIVISGDTLPCEEIEKLAQGADLLIHESTFGSDRTEEAAEFKHTTAAQAARIAKKAKVKKLVLIHFSPRYKNVKPLLEEAKKIFPNTVLAEDGMKLIVK